MINVFGLFHIISNQEKAYIEAVGKMAEELGKMVFKQEANKVLASFDKHLPPVIPPETPKKKKHRRYYPPKKKGAQA